MSTEDQIKFERIEAYLMGNLSVQEMRAFETELEVNAALQAEVDLQRDLQTSIEMGGLLSTLEDLHIENQDKIRKIDGRFWFGMAATLAVIVSLSYWSVSYQPQTEILFAEYATSDPGMPVPMSATDQYDFYDAMVDYKTEKYELAIEKWSGLLIEKPHNDTLLYFIASAHFNQAQYENALYHYTQMGVDATKPFKDKAQWYSLLCDLKLDNKASVLSVTPHGNSPYRERILSIQEALKE